MTHIHYQHDELYIEDVPARRLAEHFETPLYVYSQGAIETAYKTFCSAFQQHPMLVCYAVKANSNLAVLGLLAHLGAGFDIVSGGELERVLRAGGKAAKIVFSGVGKQDWEIIKALEAGIACFNVESAMELEQIQRLASSLDYIAPISLRVNPDVDAKTHPYISTGLRENKFGVSMAAASSLYEQAQGLSHIKIKGIDCHIGSQITELAPFMDAMTRVLALVYELALLGIELDIEHERASQAANALETMSHEQNVSSEPTEDLSLEDYFQHFVLEHQERMTETELANKLGISRKCLWERRQRLGIPRKKTANS